MPDGSSAIAASDAYVEAGGRVALVAADSPSTKTSWWWSNASVLIGVLAFLLSLLTSLVSAYTAHQKDVHDEQAALSATVEKILQLRLDRAKLHLPADVGIDQVLDLQVRAQIGKAYNLTQDLGLKASAAELLTVADELQHFENYVAAKEVYGRATLVTNNFSDEVSALRLYGVAMIQHAQNDHERNLGEQAFGEAMNIGDKYPDVNKDVEEISWSHAKTQIAWTEAWSKFDCTKANSHLQEADSFTRKASDPQDLRAEVSSWQERLQHCDESGRLPIRQRGGMAGSVDSAPSAPNSSRRPPPPGAHRTN